MSEVTKKSQMQLLGVTPHILYKAGGRLTGCSLGGAVVGGRWSGVARPGAEDRCRCGVEASCLAPLPTAGEVGLSLRQISAHSPQPSQPQPHQSG